MKSAVGLSEEIRNENPGKGGDNMRMTTIVIHNGPQEYKYDLEKMG